MNALAFAMFVALALLSNTQGKDAGSGRLSPPRAANTEVAINNFNLSPQSYRARGVDCLRSPVLRDFGNKIKLNQ